MTDTTAQSQQVKVKKRFKVMAKKDIGKDKPMWLPVGTIIHFDNGGTILELNHLPGQTFSVFEDSADKKDGNDQEDKE